MLDNKELLKLMIATTKANRSEPVAYSYEGKNFTYEALNETLRNEMNELAGTWQLFRENKNTIFSLIEQTLDEILPKSVAGRYDSFAETKTYAQGDKPIFKRKFQGRNRAKQFITRVGVAGIYEVFKLGGPEYFEVPTSAIGGAAQIGFEEFLDGRVDWGEVTQIVYEGMDELISKEIQHALIGAITQLPAANKISVAGFDETAMDRMVALAAMYGEPTIYCDYEFAVKMIPQDGWISDDMRNQRWQNGWLGNYKGRKVVILPQGLVDESNERKQMDPGYVWIIPAGAESKPVKIAIEGNTIVDEFVNKDRSREIQVYKKVGVGVIMTNNIFSYVDTSLKGQFQTAKMFAKG